MVDGYPKTWPIGKRSKIAAAQKGTDTPDYLSGYRALRAQSILFAYKSVVVVIDSLARWLGDPFVLLEHGNLGVVPDAFDIFSANAGVLAARVRAREPAVIRQLVRKVQVLAERIEIEIEANELAALLGTSKASNDRPRPIIAVPVRLKRSGTAMRLVQGGQQASCEPDRALVRLVAKARGFWLELRKGELPITELAEREKLSPYYLTRLVRLAFLPRA